MVEGESNDRDAGASGESLPHGTGKRWLISEGPRPLTEKELASPITTQFLLDWIGRLERDVDELKDYRERFHEKDKAVSVLEHRLIEAHSKNVIFDLALAFGMALLGLSPGLLEQSRLYGGVVLFAGLALAGSASAAKVRTS